MELLPALIRKYRTKIRPDEYILDREAIVYIHLAVGQASIAGKPWKEQSQNDTGS